MAAPNLPSTTVGRTATTSAAANAATSTATTTAPTNFTEAMVRERSQQRKEPAWLLEDRLAALKRYASLPVESSPLFTRHVMIPAGIERLQPGSVQVTLPTAAHRGVTLTSLDSGIPDAAKSVALNDLPGFEHDKYSNLLRALFDGGAVLHVAKDVHVEETLILRYEKAAEKGAGFARNLFLLEPGARATVLLENAVQGPGVLGLTLEAVLGAGSELRLLGVDTAGEQHTTLITTQVRAGDEAKIEVHHAFTGGALTKSRTDVVLQGRGSRTQQSEVVFGHGAQRFDLTTNITHAGAETTSEALSKAALKDAAKANIKGVILLQQSGKDSDSYLGQHAMLLSKQARCIAIPSLEIVNREIKRAKHAATVAQVDEAQIFYLQTRGLSEAEARKAVVLGFLGPLLARLGEGLGEKLRADIDQKWSQ